MAAVDGPAVAAAMAAQVPHAAHHSHSVYHGDAVPTEPAAQGVAVVPVLSRAECDELQHATERALATEGMPGQEQVRHPRAGRPPTRSRRGAVWVQSGQHRAEALI
jgi:hypothetical protein